MSQATYRMYPENDMITCCAWLECGACSKQYKLKKNGCPTVHFFRHVCQCQNVPYSEDFASFKHLGEPEPASEPEPALEPEPKPEPESESESKSKYSESEKFLAVMYSCNKCIPIVYEILIGKDDMDDFVKEKKLKYYHRQYNDEDGIDEETCEEHDDLETLDVVLDGVTTYRIGLEARRYKITDKSCFQDKNDYTVSEHMNNCSSWCAPEIMIVRMEEFSVRDIMRECIGDF